MTERKELGKITKASFGKLYDRPNIFGLFLEFGGQSWGIGDGGRYAFNIEYKGADGERNVAALKVADTVKDILDEAKVSTVDQLIGIPVEVTTEGNMFKSFRVLTEVL